MSAALGLENAPGPGDRQVKRMMKRSLRFARIPAMCAALSTVSLALPAAGLARADVGTAGEVSGGAQAWVSRDAGANHAYDDAAGMAVSPDGSMVYVAR